MKRIIAAVDFSDITGEVIRQAGELGKAFSAEVVVLHIAAPNPDYVGYEAGPQTVRDARAKELRREHRDLEQMAADLSGQGITSRSLLAQGPTVEKILSEAGDLEADLILMGSHGRGALLQALLGSVTQGVVKEATCPVMIIPVKSAQ